MLAIYSLENATEFIEKEVNKDIGDLKIVTALIYDDWLLVFYENKNNKLLDKEKKYD